MDGIQLFFWSERSTKNRVEEDKEINRSIHHLTTMPEYQVAPTPAPPRPSKRSRHFQEARAPVVPPPFLPNEVILEQILTRVPAADTIRFRAVCREWRAALTSDHFVRAHQAVVRAAAQPPSPEIVFFAPTAAGSTTTSFYSSRLLLTTSTAQQNGGSSSSARELVTVRDMPADDLVISGTKLCRGLTLLFQPSVSAYHVCNLSTGEHVSLPPCPWARRVIADGPYVLSSTGLGFDRAANEHKVVRLFEDWNKQPHCEVYGLRSGGWWRPCAGDVPPHAPRGLCSRPPVFVDGYLYWHMNTEMNFYGWEARSLATPEPILSLAVDTEQFRWVHPPEERARYAFHLADLDGFLCAVVDTRLTVGQYELWTLTAAAAAGSTTTATTAATSPWTLRCRISLASVVPRPMGDALRAGFRVLPLGSSPGGEILLATSRHEVYAYDPESNRVRRAFSTNEFVDTLTRESELLLNIAVHEEWVTPVCRRRGAGDDVGKLKMKPGNRTVARQGGQGPTDRRRDDAIVMAVRMFCLHQRDNNGLIRPNI